jgi:hypothetical protein
MRRILKALAVIACAEFAMWAALIAVAIIGQMAL